MMRLRSFRRARAAAASVLGMLIGVGSTAAFGSPGCDQVRNKGLTVLMYGGYRATSAPVSDFAIGDQISITTGCKSVGPGGCSSTLANGELRTGNGTRIEGKSYEVKGVDDDKTLTLTVIVTGGVTGMGWARAECTPAGAK
jgi:hypothetical protein